MAELFDYKMYKRIPEAQNKIHSHEKLKIPGFGTTTIGPVDSQKSGCVDPRKSVDFIQLYGGELATLMNDRPNVERDHHHDWVVRNPGGDFGVVMATMATLPELPAEQSVFLVKKWKEEQGEQFTLHGAQGSSGSGCGHRDLASNKTHEKLYGVPAEKVQQAGEEIEKLAIEDPDARIKHPILKDNHREKRVLVVLSDESDPRTILARAEDTGEEAFRLDLSAYERELKSFADFLQRNGINTNVETLIANAIKQGTATLSLLAERMNVELLITQIDLRNGAREIQNIGLIPTPKELLQAA